MNSSNRKYVFATDIHVHGIYYNDIEMKNMEFLSSVRKDSAGKCLKVMKSYGL